MLKFFHQHSPHHRSWYNLQLKLQRWLADFLAVALQGQMVSALQELGCLVRYRYRQKCSTSGSFVHSSILVKSLIAFCQLANRWIALIQVTLIDSVTPHSLVKLPLFSHIGICSIIRPTLKKKTSPFSQCDTQGMKTDYTPTDNFQVTSSLFVDIMSAVAEKVLQFFSWLCGGNASFWFS